MADYAYSQMAANLKQDRCHRFDYAGVPITGDKEMTVYWEVAHNKMADAVEFLNRWPTGDAYLADPATPTQLLTSPVVDNEPYAGKWRVARNWYDPQISGKVFQTRRFGSLTTLLTGTNVDWTEARILSGRDHLVFGDPVAGQTDDYVVIGWRNLAPGYGPVLAKQLVDKGANPGGPDEDPKTYWHPLGASGPLGNGWHILPPRHETAQDGSATVTVAFVKLGVTVTSYSNNGGEILAESILERCPEDQLQARAEALKDSTNPVYTDIAPSRDPVSGICQIRYTKLTPNPDAAYYRTESEPGQYEYHKLAWEVTAANISAELNWSGEGWPTGEGIPEFPTSIEHLLRRVASVRRNPSTGRWSYHIVLADGGEQLSTDPDAPNTSYRIKFEERRMWSILNNMYWDQTRMSCYAHQTCVFASFAAANAWIGGANPGAPDVWLDGQPVWTEGAPSLVQEGAAQPRLIGVNKWLAQRRVLAWGGFSWYPPEPT